VGNSRNSIGIVIAATPGMALAIRPATSDPGNAAT
jgi:hypothetical protein